MMSMMIVLYFLIQLSIVIFAVISLSIWDKRYIKNHGVNIPMGFEKTVDPNNGKRFRVYYNPNTGERFYHEERSDG